MRSTRLLSVTFLAVVMPCVAQPAAAQAKKERDRRDEAVLAEDLQPQEGILGVFALEGRALLDVRQHLLAEHPDRHRQMVTEARPQTADLLEQAWEMMLERVRLPPREVASWPDGLTYYFDTCCTERADLVVARSCVPGETGAGDQKPWPRSATRWSHTSRLRQPSGPPERRS